MKPGISGLVVSILTFSVFGTDHLTAAVKTFELDDANPRSRRFKQKVTPEDYRQQISVWYFGAAT